MAAPMIGRDMLAQEVEQLQKTKSALQTATKVEEVKLRGLREQVVLKQYEVRQELAAVQEAFEVERAALAHAVIPLREETARLQERIAVEERRMKALIAKHAAAVQQQYEVRADVEKQIAKRQAQLQEMEQSIARHKAVAASL